ncbi:MAG: hypothetical protein E7034_09775 [Akkermansiaceae bacterium]|nr:hypothetical protein [Akkermansiaceae bacterium]
MFEKTRIAILIMCLGLCAGLGAHYLLDKESGILVERPVSIKIPEGGVQTDKFGIRLFQAAMETAPGDSCMVCPFLVSETLLTLKELANDSLRQDIEKLGIGDYLAEHAAAPNMSMALAADYGLFSSDEQNHEHILRLPFRSDLPMAMSLFNGALGLDGIGKHSVIIGSDFLTRDTKFIAGLYADYTPKMQPHFLASDSIVSEFENANGSLPKVCMMRLRANVRYAKDTSGDWEAVAILLKPDLPVEGDPVAFMAILPTRRAAIMAAALTAEQLGTIRKALAEATPSDCCVELPQMRWSLPTHNLESLLRNMGLGRLFDITENNWTFTERKLGLDAMAEKIGITLTHEQRINGQQTGVDNAATKISFNRPFIWLIGDLTTATPAYYIGLVQNL